MQMNAGEIKSPVTAFYTDPQSAGSQTTMIETEIFVSWKTRLVLHTAALTMIEAVLPKRSGSKTAP